MNKQNYTGSPFQFFNHTSAQLMLKVLLCLAPATVISAWCFGIGVYLNIIIAVVFGLLFEALALKLRGKNIKIYLGDLSITVTSVLFALALPIGLSWHLVVAGIAFAVFIGKHAYGGLGQNSFNPAMCGYLFLLLSYPLEMTSWHLPLINSQTGEAISPWSINGLEQSLYTSFGILFENLQSSQAVIDGMTMATPLIEYKMASPAALMTAYESSLPLFARESNTAWELVNIFYFCGGIALITLKVIRWHIPVAVLGSLTLISLLFYSDGSSTVVGTPYLHLLNGGTMLGAFFIATDPVSSAATVRGRLVYGAIIGLAIYSIRVWGSYLDGVAIAIIFANFFAPLIDHFLKPTVHGHTSSTYNLLKDLKAWAGK